MQSRKLGINGPTVSALGLGCMGMTPIYAMPDPKEAINTITTALELGVNLIDTADMYGGGKNEELVGRALKDVRDKAFLASKFGNLRLPDGTRKICGTPEYVAEACDKSLQRMGVEHIDLYYLHRVDPTVPIEDTVGAMGKLVQDGKVGAIGLSEAGATTIRKAHATFPLAAVQTEYSLASRDIEKEILPVCRELGISFVAYAPLSRGLLSGEITNLDQLREDDRRHAMPRFQGDNLSHNLQLLDTITPIANHHQVSNAAICIAWVLSRGEDVIPIPGCSKRKTLEDSLTALNVELSADELDQISAALQKIDVRGTRYPEKQMSKLGI